MRSIGRGAFGRLVALAIAAASAAGRAAAADVPAATPDKVQAAIDRGKAFLYKAERGDNWEAVTPPDPDEKAPFGVRNEQWGGLTAIAAYALIAAGDDPQKEPGLGKAVQFLLKAQIRGIYALSLRDQVLNLLPADPAVRRVIDADRDLLLHAVCTKGRAKGFYGYGIDTPKDQADHSTSQFAVLGMWALQQAGGDVPVSYWKVEDDVWRSHQLGDGGWCYAMTPTDTEAGGSRLSMTAAGVATLFITQEYTRAAPKCQGNIADPWIDKGLAWMAGHLRDEDLGRRYYTLFGISRVGLASGHKFIGPTDWFKWGSGMTVAGQQTDGSWGGVGGEGNDNFNGISDAAFAVLFLARGQAAVVMNKLQYDVVPTGAGKKPAAPAAWNQRPRDVANLVRMMSKQLETPLNWQVVNLRDGVSDLHDAPILYLSGGAAPNVSPDDVVRLRAFCDEGGILLGHADCGNLGFADGFRKLGAEMYPNHAFRPLPADNPIFKDEPYPKRIWKGKAPPLEGLSNGAREMMLLLPVADPAKVWQGQTFAPFKTDPQSQMMMDVLFYAVDQTGLRKRGQTYLLTRKADAPAAPPVKVARLSYEGNWNPEPAGWPRLAVAMHNDGKAELDVQMVNPSDGPIDPAFKVASLTVGGPAVPLSDAARDHLRAYVDAGGLLLVDVLGGVDGYKAAADAAVAGVFPDAPKELPALPADSPALAGGAPEEVKYRRYARAILGRPRGSLLRGFERNGKLAVVLSREDVSVGLVGQPVDGILGYDPATATRLVEGVINYAAKR